MSSWNDDRWEPAWEWDFPMGILIGVVLGILGDPLIRWIF